ncbi:hypothetical protein EDB86DRAFT_2837040 [Lactarius hatsudake]|nr:hypothetical protein EDB86DRAFT_2837040 [Lactarius hatsudake]
MSDQRGMRSHSSSRTLLEYQDGTVINLHKATTLPLLPIISRICAYLSLSQEILDIIYRLCRFPLAAPRGVGRVVARLLRYVFIFTVLVQFILSGVAGVMSHLASQVHTVARNTHSITLAVCALPVPFKNVFCAGISNGLLSLLNPSVDKSLSWHPFLINEDIHGPAVDFAIRKTTNATSANRQLGPQTTCLTSTCKKCSPHRTPHVPPTPHLRLTACKPVATASSLRHMGVRPHHDVIMVCKTHHNATLRRYGVQAPMMPRRCATSHRNINSTRRASFSMRQAANNSNRGHYGAGSKVVATTMTATTATQGNKDEDDNTA